LTTGPDAVVDSALALLGDDGPLGSLREDFTKRTADALVRKLANWSWNRSKSLWNTAARRVTGSGRMPKSPRVEAFLEITKYGASEERPDLREAFENLASRAMTDEEWDHDFEHYAQKLSKLRSGDLVVLSHINRLMIERDKAAMGSGVSSQFPSVSQVSEYSHLDKRELMGTVDRLEVNELVQVVHQNMQFTRVPGVWFDPSSGGISIRSYQIAPTVLGTELLGHIVGLDQG